jgi:hypothetical protein
VASGVATTATPGPSVSGNPTPQASRPPRVLSVSLAPLSTELGVKPRTGATPVRVVSVQLTSSIVMEPGATYSAPVWTSSNNSVATVDSKGLVSSGVATGSAVIKVTIGTAEATAGVTVIDLGGAGVTIG